MTTIFSVSAAFESLCAGVRRIAAAVLAGALALTLVQAGPREVAAQQMVDIVAVVNDEPITAYDLQQRLNLIIRSSALQDTPAVREDLRQRVIDTLVEEVLQLQEAKRRNVSVGNKEIDSALALIERQNKIPVGGLDGFLQARNIDKQTLIHQVRANLAWTNVVRQKFLRTITVTDEEVDRTLQRIEDNADAPRLLLAEIFIAVDSPREAEDAQRNARRIFEEIRRGASFPLLARQFSQSASAKRGGDLGWVLPGELEPEVQEVLTQLPTNAVTEPVRTASGFYIMALRDRRAPATNTAEDTTVALRQVMLRLPVDAGEGAVDSQQELARTIRQTVRGCDDFLAVAKELDSKMSGDLGELKLSELPKEIREVVADIEIGTPSQPLRTANGLRLLMVCDRRAPQANLPSRDDVRQRLVIQRLEVRARRYLRELRDSAFLDIRGA